MQQAGSLKEAGSLRENHLMQQVFYLSNAIPVADDNKANITIYLICAANTESTSKVLKSPWSSAQLRNWCFSQRPEAKPISLKRQRSLWQTLMSSHGTSITHHTLTVLIIVPTCIVPTGYCTYGHQLPTTLYLHAKF